MIPFLDLSRANAPHMERIEAAMLAVARSGWYVLGPEVKGFEEAFAEYIGVRHCIGVANGLEALTLTLKAWNFPLPSALSITSDRMLRAELPVQRNKTL